MTNLQQLFLFFNFFCEEIMKFLIHASTFVKVWNGTSFGSHNSTLG